jgi:hypothetical protein
MATILYEPAFAVVVRRFPGRQAQALFAITVVAGFASTIFLPLTGVLVDRLGWRTAPDLFSWRTWPRCPGTPPSPRC